MTVVEPRRRLWTGLAIMAVAGAALVVFNRTLLLSGWDAVPGDLGDGRFNLAVLEHWYRVTLAAESWRSPDYYFPVPDALGYSDALVLLAPAYVAGRWSGLGMVPALAVTLATASAVGFAGMIWFLRRSLRLVWPAAMAGAGAFATGTALSQSLAIGHVQMMAIEALPWFAALVWHSLRRGGTVAASGAALLLTMILLTSFYVGWFLGLQLLVMAGLGLVMALVLVGPQAARAGAGAWLRARRWSLLVAGVSLALGLVPFLLIYGPVALQHHDGRPWAEVVRTLPDIRQWLEARGNLVWGPVAEAIWPGLSNEGGELGKGLSWGLLLVFAATVAGAGAARGPVAGLSPELRRWGLVLGISVLVCWSLLLREGAGSAWFMMYQGVPGGCSIRSVFRFNLVLSFSVAVVAAIGIHAAWVGAKSNKVIRLGVGGVVALLLIEQTNTLPGTLSRSRDFAGIEAMPAPPPACRAAVLLPQTPPPAYHRWSHQLDAVLLAQSWGLPVLNGYSGLAPEGWGLFDPTDRMGYRRAVVAWVDRYGLWDGLCGIDFEARRWFPVVRADMVP